MLTYLIKETVIADQINPVSDSIVIRSLIQSVLAASVLVSMFVFIIYQIRRNAKLSITILTWIIMKASATEEIRRISIRPKKESSSRSMSVLSGMQSIR